MAKQRQEAAAVNRFDTGLKTDIQDYHLDDKSWNRARNAINNSHIGDLGEIGNEPSNKFCTAAPYTIIGVIHQQGTVWSIYSTNDVNGHEIGLFDESTCTYTRVVNDPCLNFRSSNLIIGASRPTFDCSFQDYWADNRNPDRTMDLNNVPWVQECTDDNGEDPGGCITCIDTDVLDCDKLRLESLISPPCITITKGPSGGSILNGTYFALIAYTINQQTVTDYSTISNLISIFEHDDANASLDIQIDNLDKNFEQYELLIVSTVAEKTVVKSMGLYSTNQNKITIDFIDPTLPSVPLNNLPLSNPINDRSAGIFENGKYLLRANLTSKFDFNYQPLANQISAKWQVVEYPEDYYRTGGIHIGVMRDEVYPYFIRWVYNTGDKSSSYHIPGRAAQPYTTPDGSGVMLESDDYLNVNANNLEQIEGDVSRVYEMFNTANGSVVSIPLPDGGVITAEGQMGYWESDEYYDDSNPIVWNSNVVGRPEWDLCGKRIRHHKFPENTLYSGAGSSTVTNHYVDGQKKIRIMGVAFDNIQPPVDNLGNPITNIVGYEILRGSRNGNKTVLFKGIINNMRKYTIPPTLGINKQGLYPNYPFNGLTPDDFVSTQEVSYDPALGDTGTPSHPNDYLGYVPNPNYSKKHFTFHSPDTMINKPFLGMKEVKMYGAMWGNAEASYVEVENHPKHVFVTDVSFYVAVVVGVGYAIAKAIGTKSVTWSKPEYLSTAVFLGTSTSVGTPTGAAVLAGMNLIYDGAESLNDNIGGIATAVTGIDAVSIASDTADSAMSAANAIPGSGVTTGGYEVTYTDKSSIPPLLRIAQATYLFASDLAAGADLTLDLIRNMSKPRQHALQYQGYSGYENFGSPYTSNRRRIIKDAKYLDGHMHNYDITHRINNILRNKTVAFDTTVDIDDLVGALSDTTMYRILASDLPNNDPFQYFSRRASSHYVAFKNRLRNQYGQIPSIRQLPASYCMIPITESSTGVIFGGDTYIGRYQEKNTFFHFYKWMFDELDRAEFNYHLYDAVQHAAFWMDTEPFDVMEFTASIGPAINAAITSGSVSTFFTSLVTPSDKHCFDRLKNSKGIFTVKKAYMYLFHSSVRDFFVESELNIDMRDHGGTEATMHWNVLQDLRTMFRSRIIEAGNYYKLDRSLSVNHLPHTKISWASVQDRDYNPFVSETCYVNYNRRLSYSLLQQPQSKKDNWSVFLANNYVDFTSEITAIKSTNSTGMIILFKNQSPGLFPGVDELQLKSGTSITIGDGGLFAREMQEVTNAEKWHEYASCQNRLSAINTPVGLFFISQEQGKIFLFDGGLKEISMKDDQYWFNQYLPYQLTLDIPSFDLLDNPVAGIGCQAIYDAEWGLVYFCKKDYRVKPEYLSKTEYVGEGIFVINKIVRVKTGDPRYFDNASWTVSYDPKSGHFISHHDWHPSLTMPGKNTFLTVDKNSIWRHNDRCDSYCNYYGKDYPFEIGFAFDNMPSVTTLRNIEYYLQVFEYSDNCRDRFHVLDFNFDEAVVYNSEQTSGLLKLVSNPFNDVFLSDQYPIIGVNDIQILYSKVEQKYRFNQFWDITKDRGQYSPLVSEAIWITEPNGYIKELNPANLNYSKNQFEQKKIRHHNNGVVLIRQVSGNKKMLLTLTNTKLQNSPR